MPHIHEKIDFCVETFVVHENKVLLRKHDKYNKWLTPGGHIELHEDPTQAAIREVKEEVGLDIMLYDGYVVRSDARNCIVPPRFLNRHKINDVHEHVVLIYLAASLTDELVIPDSEKAECRWFSVDELDDEKYGLANDVRHYAKTALAEVSSSIKR